MKSVLALAATALCAISTGALAAQLAPTGQNVFTCELRSINLEEGHMLMVGNWKGTQVTNPNSPDNNSSIDCVGTFEAMPDKSFKVNGYCLHVDRDGDKWIDRWWNDSTMKKGRWEGIGISGKWKDVRGVMGNFVYTDLSTETVCKGVSNWEVAR
jgi:hypothetical protein